MKLARAWGFIVVLLVGSAALGGCREPLGGVRPLATPVAGYRALVEADEPWKGLERTWRFGDGTSETGMSLVAHTWEKPGIYDVRATAGRHGFWESQVEVRAPGEPVDLAELLGTGPKGATATAAIIVYRPEDEGSYCLLEDATVVDRLLRLIGDAQAVEQIPDSPWTAPKFHLLGPDGQYLGQVYEKTGVIGLLDPSGRPGTGYILKAPLAEVVPASVIWNPGRVVRGVVRPVIPPLPLTALPDSCRVGEPGPPAEGNVVETFSLREAGRLRISNVKDHLLELDPLEQTPDIERILALLAACPRATGDEVAGLPEGWDSCPLVMIDFPGNNHAVLNICAPLMSARTSDNNPPEVVYRVTPELEEMVRALRVACGSGE